jgi:hypothetical protein
MMSVHLILLGHMGQITGHSRHSLTKLKVNMVTLCIIVKFIGSEKGKVLQCHFEDASWVCDLAFLTDVSGHVSDLNSKLQGICQPLSELCSYRVFGKTYRVSVYGIFIIIWVTEA